MQRLLLICCLSVALLGATAGAASALTGSEGPIVNSDDGFQTGVATCPDGERVVSGGFSGSQANYALINRAEGKKAWMVKGSFFLPATVYAYCSPRLKVDVAEETKKFSGSGALKVSAECAKGLDPVAGGWEYLDPASNSPVFTSAPSGSRWTVGGFQGGSTAKKLRAFAYCARGDNRVDKSSEPMPADDTATGLAGCGGDALLAGGFKTTPKPDFDNLSGPRSLLLRHLAHEHERVVLERLQLQQRFRHREILRDLPRVARTLALALVCRR